MFCGKCGRQIPDDTVVCPYCSDEQHENQYTENFQYAKKPLDNAAISTVLGIIGLVFCFSCAGFIINIIGIVFGIKAKNETGRKAGLVMSIIGIVLTIITTIATIGWIGLIVEAISQYGVALSGM